MVNQSIELETATGIDIQNLTPKSVLFFELDDPRHRRVLVQITGD